jgi:hypothetical protein
MTVLHGRKTTGLVTALAGLGLTATLNAATVNWHYTSNTPSDTIRRTVDGGTSYFTTNLGYFNCVRDGGDFTGTLRGPDSSTSTFIAFCAEPREFVNDNVNYFYTTAPLSEGTTNIGGMGTVKANRLNILIGHFLPDFDVAIPNTSAGYQKAAALQVAVWEIVRESLANPLNVYAGQVMFNTESRAGTLALAQTYLDTVSDNGIVHPAPHFNLMALNSGTLLSAGNQDLLVQYIHEPGTLSLLGIGAAGLLLRRRKRNG